MIWLAQCSQSSGKPLPVVQRTWFSWLDSTWGKASSWVSQLNKQPGPTSSSNPAVLSLEEAGLGSCLSLLGSPVAEFDTELNLHGFFGVDVQFCLLSGEQEYHWILGCAEVSVVQFNHLYKIPQPEKRDVVWWQKCRWAAHVCKQSLLEQDWCLWFVWYAKIDQIMSQQRS